MTEETDPGLKGRKGPKEVVSDLWMGSSARENEGKPSRDGKAEAYITASI